MRRILIVDNQYLMRLSLRVIVREIDKDSEITEAENFKQALKLLPNDHFDLIILEVLTDEFSGVKMIDMVRNVDSSVSVLICSTADELLYAEHYILQGANGFVMKADEREEIVTAISTVMNGNRYVSEKVHARLLTRTRLKSNINESLTRRESQILPLILEGRTIREISTILEIHVKSINFYKLSIFRKMQVNNILELADRINLSEHLLRSYPPVQV